MLLYSGELRLNDDSHRVTVGVDEINLTRNEYEILRLLLMHKGSPVSMSKISDATFGSRATPATIKVHVCHIRKKIGYSRIASVYGTGYMVPSVKYFDVIG